MATTYYRALRTEGHVAVGPYTGDFEKGKVYSTKRGDDKPWVSENAADYLVAHDLLMKVDKDAEDNPWFDSEDTSINGGVDNDQVHGPISNIHRMDHDPEG